MPNSEYEVPKLNDGLDPDNFWICVPWDCQWWNLGRKPIKKPDNGNGNARVDGLMEPWKEYLKSLELPKKVLEKLLQNPEYCCTCPKNLDGGDKGPCLPCMATQVNNCWGCPSCTGGGADPRCRCRSGWLLRGEAAIAHARRVHHLIHRHLLRFKDVNAVDVGFAVRETDKKFINLLAIRIHVAKKRPTRDLEVLAEPHFTSLAYAFTPAERSNLRRGGGSRRGDEWAAGGPTISWDEFMSCLHKCCSERAALTLAGGTFQSLTWAGLRDWLAKLCCKLQHPNSCEPQADGLCGDCTKLLACLKKCWLDQLEIPDCLAHCSREDGSDLGWKLQALLDEVRWLKSDKYPVPGIGHADLSVQCCRLCICGVPLDVIESSYFPAARHPGGDFESGVFAERAELSVELPDEELELIGRGRVSPLVGGVSVGSVGGSAGTLSAVVWDCTDGTPCLLSNWHVLAGSPAAKVGQPTYQPALFDGGTTDDVVAHLKRWHLGEEGDVAIAELSDDRSYAAGEVLGLWHSLAGYQAPSLNLEVRKWGRTTGFTEGFVDGIHLATSIEYGNGLSRFFRDQFHIAPLYQGQDVSQVGDSGSLVVTKYVPAEWDVERRAWEDEKSKWEAVRQKWTEVEKNAIGILQQCLEPSGEKTAKDFWAQIVKTPADDRDSIEDLVTIFESIKPPLAARTPGAGGGSPSPTSPTPCDDLAKCLEDALKRESPDPIVEQLHRFLTAELKRFGFDLDAVLGSMEYRKELEQRRKTRVYLAVGLIFAGDTPGSAFGEFALASDIRVLMEKLHFSLRPVFEPRSSFRRLRTRQGGRSGRGGGEQATVEPGDQRPDPRNQGPTPDGQSVLRGPASGGGP